MRVEKHRRAVREAFDRAAPGYDKEAGMQRAICRRLLEVARAHPPGVEAQRILDAGCGTGYALPLLAELAPGAKLFGADFAPAMLRQCCAVFPSAQLVCADLEQLPLADASVDALWSSLSMQWCGPRHALRECARVLAPGGVAWIATLAPNTLHELRTAFRAVDDKEHVLQFTPPETWLTEAAAAGFSIEASHRESISFLAPDLRSIIRHLKGIGAHRPSARPGPPLGKTAWRHLETAYDAYRRTDGMLPATYDV